MNVGQLKILLEDVDDDVEILIPFDASMFNGLFYSPCIDESGEGDSVTSDFNETFMASERSFLLLPHGFFDDIPEDTSHELN